MNVVVAHWGEEKFDATYFLVDLVAVKILIHLRLAFVTQRHDERVGENFDAAVRSLYALFANIDGVVQLRR